MASEKPWDGAASNYADTAAFCRACLINENEGDPKTWVQAKCHLPVKEPGGDVNANAVRNALARINQVQAPAAAKQAAMRKLQALRKQLKIGAENQ